jgi:uroporphyrin-III C-methyltransferase/precorrin-2 dehydrogenase/sirohydrochlorin ferrochelatase
VIPKGPWFMFLPLFFKSGLSCLVIGGGTVASHKIRILLDASCTVTVIAPRISEDISEAVKQQRVRWKQRAYSGGDCEGYGLVIAATPVRAVNRRVSEEASGHGIPVNVVDDPELSTVIFPAIWRENSLAVAVSTGGAAPFMAAEIRSRISNYARGLGAWVELGKRFRETVKREILNADEKNALYQRFLDACRPDCALEPPPPRENDLNQWLDWLERLHENGK